MLTKEQYIFLKAFVKKSKKSKKNNELLSSLNREKITEKEFFSLLRDHPKLCPSEPFVNEGDDALSVNMVRGYVNNSYLKMTGLEEYIVYFDSGLYGISINGLQEMSEYKIEITSKIKLPIIAIVISLVSLIIAVIALCI